MPAAIRRCRAPPRPAAPRRPLWPRAPTLPSQRACCLGSNNCSHQRPHHSSRIRPGNATKIGKINYSAPVNRNDDPPMQGQQPRPAHGSGLLCALRLVSLGNAQALRPFLAGAVVGGGGGHCRGSGRSSFRGNLGNRNHRASAPGTGTAKGGKRARARPCPEPRPDRCALGCAAPPRDERGRSGAPAE